MRKFIVRLSVFGLIVVGVFGAAAFGFFYADIRQYYEVELKMPPQASVVTINDSQTSMGIDPEVDDRYWNCSAPGRTMDQAYLILLDLLRVNPGRIKTVLIDVSPASAREDFQLSVAEMSYASQYYLLHLLHPNDSYRPLGDILPVIRDHLIGRRWRHVWRAVRGKMAFHSSFGRIPTPRDVVMSKANPKGYRNVVNARVSALKASAPLTEQSEVFRIIDMIVDKCETAGIEPVLVTTPWDETLLAATESERGDFSELVGAYARKHGLRYLNFLSVDYPEDLWFDPIHLTVNGGKRFTREFSAALFR